MMEKQKKQLIGLLVILIAAIAVWVAVSGMPDETQEEENADYQVTNLVQDSVIKLVYTNENGTVTLNKEGDDWICDEDKSADIDEAAVKAMVGRVAALTSENQLEQVEDISQYGLDEPTLIILVSDGTTTNTLLIGAYNETTDTYYMCLENDRGTVYTVKPGDILSFQNHTLEDITVVEETTEAETQTATE